MSKIGGVIECQNGYKIKWKIDYFQFLQQSFYRNSPQILESDHFIMWDCNWKFKLSLVKSPFNNGVDVGVSLEVLDVQSWDEKGLSISASLNAIYKGGDKSESKNTPDQKLQAYKVNYGSIFYFANINDRIRHDFEFIWSILLVDFDASSAQYGKRHKPCSNVEDIKNIVGLHKWGVMMDDTESHDVKIRCQGVEMTAHKLILSGSSSVFKAMFHADMKETRESLIEVTRGTPEAVKAMLAWIYNREIVENRTLALELLKLAHYYDLKELMEECQLILVDTICKENVIQVINDADLMGAKILKDSAIQFIIKNKKDFKEDLEKLKPKLIVEILLAQKN